jgi:hypothetical protein
MTVTTSYPGIYIQGLPNLVQMITPVPTSTDVFVGCTNPFYPGTEYRTAIQLFSSADYQANFVGIFELLAIIGQQLQPGEREDALPAEGASGTNRAGAAMRASRRDPPTGPQGRPANSGEH